MEPQTLIRKINRALAKGAPMPGLESVVKTARGKQRGEFGEYYLECFGTVMSKRVDLHELAQATGVMPREFTFGPFDDIPMLNSTQRPKVFLEWAHALQEKYPDRAALQIWTDLVEHWTGFDSINHRAYASLLRRIKPERPQEITQDIPHEPLTVYRGQSELLKPGLSWTRRLDVAMSFARGHRGMRNPEPVVYSRIVKPEHIAFVTDKRGEAEVVLWSGTLGKELVPIEFDERLCEVRSA